MHLFPQLRKIERKYGDRVAVVGVHSPKFPAERETANLREAVLRYRIEHPVVNDRDFEVWRRFGGRAWPTLVFIDPQGRVIGKHEGELPFDTFDPLVEGMLREFEERGLLHAADSSIRLEALQEPDSSLSFPGKVLAADDSIYIADTNHHRIVIASTDGEILGSIGSGEPGLRDGAAQEACFQQPQGMALAGRILYVADTENHALRAIDIDAGSVRTVAGTGEQAQRPDAGGDGRATALSSPWDLASDGRRLYVAMAGTHQIWTFDTVTGQVAPFAGTGREGLQDGPAAESWFAQSSGLTIDEGHLYVADSEVSAVRDIELASGTVSTLVGEGLFVFGDADGIGEAARLQHPLGIAAHERVLYVADSYNHKIKRLDPRSRQIETWLGSGEPGDRDGTGLKASFREPGGISAAKHGLYIADTNNHRIAFASWTTGVVRSIIR
jgi:hypothetical protein